MSMLIRAVYDCMVLVQAAARPSRAHTTPELARSGEVELCLSPAILEEVSDVLMRPEVQAKFPDLRPAVAAEFLAELLEISATITNVPEVFHLARDPKEPYINLAIMAQPCSLVTWNEKHLTYLMKQNTPEGIDLCKRFPGVGIMDPPTSVRFVNSRV